MAGIVAHGFRAPRASAREEGRQGGMGPTSARMKPLNTHHVGLADTSLIQQITTASNVAWIVAGGAGTPGVFDKRGGMQGKEREGRNNKEGKDRGKAN